MTAPLRHLRVGLVFGGAILAEEVVAEKRPVVLGYGSGAVLPLPPGVSDATGMELMRPVGGLYQVFLEEGMGGSVWFDGVRHEVSDLAGRGANVLLGPDDFGVLTLGECFFFFQMVKPAPRLGRQLTRSLLRPSHLLALVLSLVLHAAVVALGVLAIRHGDRSERLELDNRLVARLLVTPPPPERRAPRRERREPAFETRLESATVRPAAATTALDGHEPRASVAIESPLVSPSEATEAVVTVARRNEDAVRYCYGQAAPTVPARVEVRWRVAPNGSVSSADLVATSLEDERAEGCIVRRIRQWRFPPRNEGEVTANMAFVFTPRQ